MLSTFRKKVSRAIRQHSVFLTEKLEQMRHFNPISPDALNANGPYVFRGIGDGSKDVTRKQYVNNILNKGLKPLGTRPSIKAHITNISDHNSPPDEKTSYISFTQSMPVARQFAGSGGYVIASSPPEIMVIPNTLELGIDMALGLSADGEPLAAKYREEDEIAAAIPMSPNAILGMRKVGMFGTWLGECQLNDKYSPNNFSIHILSKDPDEHVELEKNNLHRLPNGYRYITFPEAEIFAKALRDAAKEYDREKIINSEFHFHIDAIPMNQSIDCIKNLITQLFHEQMNDHGLEKNPPVYFSNQSSPRR